MNFKEILRYIYSVLGYVFCIATACIIARMIDGSGGVMIATILILAFIISQLVMLYVRKKISAELICSHKLLAKGDKLTAQIKLRKSTVLPTPFIEIELASAPQLSPDDKVKYKLTLTSIKNYEEISVPFTAVFCGMSSVEIKSIQLVDFLGVIRHRISNQSQEPQAHKVRVMPNIPDTGAQPEILKTTSESAGFDDSEEETSESAIGSTGTPGYEHRVYSPGDPIKKINWKLSSKRSVFMVRLDEKLAVSSQVFVLDCPRFTEMNQYDYQNFDIVIEGCLAMLAMLVQQGSESECHYFIGEWRSISIKSMKDVIDLQEELSWFVPVTPAERIPADVKRSGGVVCFTGVDMAHSSLAQELFEDPDMMLVVSENSGFNAGSAGNIWTCTQEFEFKKLV